MVDVDDHVAGLQALEQVAWHHPPHGPRAAHTHRPEELAVGDELDAIGAPGEAAIEAALDERQATGGHRLVKVAQRRRADAVVFEDLREAS